MFPKISGVILAGGAGKRFHGRQKAKAEIDGVPIISRILSVITDFFDEIIIVTNNPDDFKEITGCLIFSDEIPEAGPLGGIHTAMKRTSSDAVFVFAGDMPFLDHDIIQTLLNAFNSQVCDAVIPEANGYIEPLHAIYSASLADKLELYLRNNGDRAVREFIKDLSIRYVHLEDTIRAGKAFTNINSQSDIDLFDHSGGI